MARFNPKKARRRTDLEWVGGRFTSPSFVTDEGEPYRPEILVWLEPESASMVYAEITDPREGGASLADALELAMAQPMEGPKRRPSKVRVARSEDAAELRARFGASLEVVRAPTPEVLDASASYAEFASRDLPPDVWLEHLPADAPEVARFFEATRRLYAASPWSDADDIDELRVDVPDLGLHGACASLLGSTGEAFGFLLFPSFAGLEAFLDAAELVAEGEPPADYGTTWLALEFEPSPAVPRELRKLIASRGLPLASPSAVPWPKRVERDGLCAPLTLQDLGVLAAVANAIAHLWTQHADAIAQGDPLSVTLESQDHPPVRLSIPYEAGARDEVVAPLAAPEPGRRSPAHDVDERLIGPMLRFGTERFGQSWSRFIDDLENKSESLAVPWAQYVFEVDGRPLFEHFLDEHAELLSPHERAWLEAQRPAWASFWEVTRVDPGRALALRDLLSGETREVIELAASRDLPVRSVLFGRVVEYGDHSVLAGIHPRSLGPLEAELAVQEARRRLRTKRAPRVAPDKLRPHPAARVLLEEWERAVAVDDVRRAAPPELQNTDGDAVLMTVDHYRFAPADRREVVRKLALVAGAEPEDEASEAVVFMKPGNAVHASWHNTVIGRAEPRASSLRIETSSVQRADDLRRRIEDALGGLIEHRAREHADPTARVPASSHGPGIG